LIISLIDCPFGLELDAPGRFDEPFTALEQQFTATAPRVHQGGWMRSAKISSRRFPHLHVDP
jgi:hypothetical protein